MTQMRNCLGCGGDISHKDRRAKFCDRSCAATYNNKKCLTGRGGRQVSEAVKARLSEAAIRRHEDSGTRRQPRSCAFEECSASFLPPKRSSKYCSNDCRIKARGGIRQGKISFRTMQKMFKRAFPDWKCPFCGWDATVNIHHIKPRSESGSDDLSNLVALCPNHHSVADLGQIEEEVLIGLAIGSHYTNEEFIQRFYFGPATEMVIQD